MKFVAKVPFHNAPELGLKLDPNDDSFQHPKHVPKGYRFELAPDAKSLKGVTNKAVQELIAKLVLNEFVVVDDGSNESKDAIAAIDAEVKQETKIRNLKPGPQTAEEKADAKAEAKAAKAEAKG